MFESVRASSRQPHLAEAGRGGTPLLANCHESGRQDEVLDALAQMPPGAALAGLTERIISCAVWPDHAAQAGGPGARGLTTEPAAGVDPGETDLFRSVSLNPGQAMAAAEALAYLSLDALSELIAACGRLASWASFTQALLCAGMSRHPELAQPVPGADGQPGPLPPQEEVQRNAASEIACRLGISRTRATTLLTTGECLTEPHMALTASLARSGLIDSAKTTLITRRLGQVEVHTATEVQQAVLPRAPHRTHSQLAHDIDSALTSLDPEGSSTRRKRNSAGRYVSRPRPAGEGIHEMRMVLPTPDAFLIDATLDAVAGSARAAGDERSLSQLRADTLVSMSLQVLRAGQHQAEDSRSQSRSQLQPQRGTQPHPHSSSQHQPRPTGEADLQRLLLGEPDRNKGLPGELAPGLSLPGEPDPGRLLPDGVPLEPLLASLSQLVGSTSPWWTPAGHPPVVFPPGLKVHINVTVPINQLAAAAFAANPCPAASPPGDATLASVSPSTPGSPSTPSIGNIEASTVMPSTVTSIATAPDTVMPSAAIASATTSIATAPNTVMPSAATPNTVMPSAATPDAAASSATLTAGGRSTPVPAVIAVALAAGGTWRRLLTDPVTGVVLDVGRTRYRPPAALADAVRARDLTCTHPGCQVPAARCDIDHIQPWSEGGTTSLDNLTALCEAHHRLKHTPGWSLTRTQEGSLEWHTPSRTRYRRTPDGTITVLPRRVGPRHHHQPAMILPTGVSQALTDAVINELERGLLQAAPHSPTRPPRLESRGPRPGEPIGAWSTRPLPPVLHQLGLAALLDEVIPF